MTKKDGKTEKTLLAILTTSSYTEACKVLGISRMELWRRRQELDIDKHLKDIREEAIENLKLASLKAVDVLISGLNDNRKKYESAKEILDRVGITSKNTTTLNITSPIPIIADPIFLDEEKREFGI